MHLSNPVRRGLRGPGILGFLLASTLAASAPADEATTQPVGAEAGAVQSQPTTSTAPASEPGEDLPLEADNSPYGNHLTMTPNDIHALLIDETAEVFRKGATGEVTVTSAPAGVSIRKKVRQAGRGRFRQAVYTSRTIESPWPFNDVIPSWNVAVPEGTGFIVQLRFGRREGDFWTPFYYLGKWGTVDETGLDKILRNEHGRVDIDYFRSSERFDRLQYRVLLFTTDPTVTPVLRRFALAYSNTLDDAELARKYRKTIKPGPTRRWARRLPVPYRSQTVEDRQIAGSICSPTSTSMVMEYRGVSQPTAHMAKVIWDDEYKLFGSWPRAVQGAYTFGVPGYLERFGDWEAAKRHIAAGQPIIASIKVPKIGMLRGAPYRRSNGHLLVIVGFDEQDNVQVNDPAARTPEAGMTTYTREDMEAVWFGHGGVGYILQKLPDTKVH